MKVFPALHSLAPASPASSCTSLCHTQFLPHMGVHDAAQTPQARLGPLHLLLSLPAWLRPLSGPDGSSSPIQVSASQAGPAKQNCHLPAALSVSSGALPALCKSPVHLLVLVKSLSLPHVCLALHRILRAKTAAEQCLSLKDVQCILVIVDLRAMNVGIVEHVLC